MKHKRKFLTKTQIEAGKWWKTFFAMTPEEQLAFATIQKAERLAGDWASCARRANIIRLENRGLAA